MNKNLVYFCVFYNKDYFKLLNLLLTSLKFFSTVSNFDLLIITNDNMIDNVKELEKNLQLNLKIKTQTQKINKLQEHSRNINSTP